MGPVPSTTSTDTEAQNTLAADPANSEPTCKHTGQREAHMEWEGGPQSEVHPRRWSGPKRWPKEEGDREENVRHVGARRILPGQLCTEASVRKEGEQRSCRERRGIKKRREL